MKRTNHVSYEKRYYLLKLIGSCSLLFKGSIKRFGLPAGVEKTLSLLEAQVFLDRAAANVSTVGLLRSAVKTEGRCLQTFKW